MKYMYLILIALVFSCGTDQGKGDVYYYSMTNNSGKPLTIKSYRSDFPDLEPEILNLQNNKKVEKVFRDGLPPSEYNFKVFLGESRLRDSVIVLFDNLRYTVFIEECNKNNRNPIDVCFYGDLTEDFVFTEEDYANAKECNGPCE